MVRRKNCHLVSGFGYDADVMRRSIAVPAALVALLSLGAAAASAQSPSAKDRAAALATKKAQAVTLTDVYGHGAMGTVQLEQIGRTRTRVVLTVPGGTARGPLELRRGTDCNANRNAAAVSAIHLNPVNSSRVSETIVDVPLDALQSGDYLVAVRNATQRAQFLAACARLGRNP